MEHKVVASLTTIIKAISNPLIQNRACRLLGNLAKFDATQVLSTHCTTIAQALCHIIDDTSDVQNRIMAYRACRFLLSNSQFIKPFFQSNGLHSMLKILASLMKNNDDTIDESEKLLKGVQITFKQGLKHNQHREKYFEEVARNLEGIRSDLSVFDNQMKKKTPDVLKQYKMPPEDDNLELLCEILKLLLVASEIEFFPGIWESLNRDNFTLRPIVYLTREDCKYRSVALKILSNIAKLPGGFYILSSSDAIFAACELLTCKKTTHQLNSSEIRHCINIISILSTDACNRSKIRRSGTLKELIHILRDSKSYSDKNSVTTFPFGFLYYINL